MNGSEIEVSRALLYLEKSVEEHHLLLERLENLEEIQGVDSSEVERVLKEMRKTRQEVYEQFRVIVDNIENVTNRAIREEALGIINYYYAVMLNDEKDVLETLKSKPEIEHLWAEIDKDLLMISKISSLISKFIY